MTAAQTSHLIEQFSAQAPFAIWITDSRGVAIFANHKLHELFGIQDKPSGAVGANIFEEPAIDVLGLGALRDQLRNGEIVDKTFDIPAAVRIASAVLTKHEGPMTLRAVAYPLRSSSQKIEHYVVILTDLTSSTIHHNKRRAQIKDIEVYNVTRKTRQAKENQLKAEVKKLEDELRALGDTP